jgi:uncharacterized protein (DUF305 family)
MGDATYRRPSLRNPVAGSVKGSLLAVLATALAGCSGGPDGQPAASGETAPNIVQPGAPGEGTRTLTPEELAEIESPDPTQADVRFVQGMIHHHAQALRMTNLVPERSRRRAVELLARRIDLSQESEIDLMRRWLEARGEEAPELHRPHGHAHGTGQGLMPGMLTERELDRLQAARRSRFDRLFLQFMIRHHEGALRMVGDLRAAGGGAEPEIDAFARHVESDQQIEINRMLQMLAKLPVAAR